MFARRLYISEVGLKFENFGTMLLNTKFFISFKKLLILVINLNPNLHLEIISWFI